MSVITYWEGYAVVVWCGLGFVPSTELLRNASGTHKFFTRYILHGVLRFTRQTRTVTNAGAAISAVATGDKFKGQTASLHACLFALVWSS